LVSLEVGEATATKPTGSQVCTIEPGSSTVRLSLPDTEFSQLLGASDAISLEFEKELSASGTLILEVVVSSVDEPDARFELSQALEETEITDVQLALSRITLPTHALQVSRQLRVHAKFVAADETTHESSPDVWLFFHPEGDSWRFYDEAIRDLEYSGGALTDAEREKRAAALASLPAGVSANYVDVRVTALSDDPYHVPPEDSMDSWKPIE
jgi:hypothetical protein